MSVSAPSLLEIDQGTSSVHRCPSLNYHLKQWMDHKTLHQFRGLTEAGGTEDVSCNFCLDGFIKDNRWSHRGNAKLTHLEHYKLLPAETDRFSYLVYIGTPEFFIWEELSSSWIHLKSNENHNTVLASFAIFCFLQKEQMERLWKWL